jgi:predicted RNase H-like nuclease
MSNVGLAGVDGCRGGWLAAVDHDGSIGWQWAESFRELYDDASLSTIAVDVPIGLPESGSRACDAQARQCIGKRRSSVFAAPVRAVLQHTTYADARAELEKLGATSMSAQAFGIVRAVRDVDACVTENDDDRIVEAHPEVAFFVMGGAMARKRSAQGVAQRLRTLTKWRPDLLGAMAAAPEGAPVDDALDALACLWVAERWSSGERRTLGDGRRDVRNLPMRIAPAP